MMRDAFEQIPFKILINRYNNILNIVLINKNSSKKKTSDRNKQFLE